MNTRQIPIRVIGPALAVASVLCWAQAGDTLHNGIRLPAEWPPARKPTQQFLLPPYLETPPAVIPIDLGRQLFVDDFLIEQSDLKRTAHRPVIMPEPVLRPAGGPQEERAMPFSDGVWFDPAARLFRMWYWGGFTPGISYAESTDGLQWHRPALPESEVANSNVVLICGGDRDSSTVWIDHEDPDPARRYKAFVYAGGRRLSVYFSSDGLRWVRQPAKIRSLADRTTVFWNPFRDVWVLSARSSATLPALPGTPARSGRTRYYLETKDLTTWVPKDPYSSYWAGPDALDPPYPGTGIRPELYNLDAVAYESLIVGLFSWYYPAPGPDLVEIGLGFSRDGFHWHRPTRGAGPDAFIPAANQPGAWNGYNVQSAGGAFLVVGDELWFYFSARDLPHNSPGPTMSTGLARLRRDGFYSMDAGAAEGSLLTRPVRFSGQYLFVNADASQGELRAEILDANGAVIPPFTKENSRPLRENSARARLAWDGAADLSAVRGETVRLRFYLVNGSLYSFWVTPDPDGASNGYVAAGGPGFASNVDSAAPPPVAKTRRRAKPVE